MSKPSTGWSSVGKKVLSGLTGFGLVAFIIVHLAGNLTLFLGPSAFNGYAHFLETVAHGAFQPVAEVGLLLLFLFHILSGFIVFNDKTKARPIPYMKVANAGHSSRKTMSSQSMIYTGILLLFFLVAHLVQFRFAGFLGKSYSTTLAGESVQDLYRLVSETFHHPLWVGVYVVCMIILGLHLRHGLWSMFQSLGWNNKRTLPLLYPLAIVLAIVLAVGFLYLPIYMMNQPAVEFFHQGGV